MQIKKNSWIFIIHSVIWEDLFQTLHERLYIVFTPLLKLKNKKSLHWEKIIIHSIKSKNIWLKHIYCWNIYISSYLKGNVVCKQDMGMGNSCMEMKITFLKNIGFCTTFIVFMINFTNLEINYLRLSLSLSLS